MKTALNRIVGIVGLVLLSNIYLAAQSPVRVKRSSGVLDSLRKVREARLAAYRRLPAARQRTLPDDFVLTDVTRRGQPVYNMPLNQYAALTTGVTPLQLGALGVTLQGKGMIVGVWDAGKVADHVELGNRVIYREEAAIHPHAVHVTGTIIATGINTAAKGMAPLAQARTWFYDNDYDDFYNQIGPGGVRLSNHSYGAGAGWVKISNSPVTWQWWGDPAISDKEDYRFGFYDLDAQYIDELSNIDPYHLFVWAAGNDRAEVNPAGPYPQDGNQGAGYDCLIPQAVAKNHMVVGAVSRVTNYTGPASVIMSNFSSWGPTDDGRIKPDVVADGVNVYSLWSTSPTAYNQTGGTSQATANVTGSLLLVQELYERLHAHTPMRAATLRALAIHTAKEAGTAPGPDYQYGWGLLDAKQAAKTLLDNDDINVMVRELTLDNQQTIQVPLQPKPGEKITVTIGWTDPAGKPTADALDPADLMLVNDLDVKLVDADGIETLPWILDPANPGAAATQGNNFRDNVEKIELDAPLDKNYTLVVTHKGTLKQSQPLSLIVTHQSKTPTGTAYYWIGNSGTWGDPAHWSLSSGGASAGAVPTAADRVILDDNSFLTNTEETVTLDTDVTCRALTWLTNKRAALDMGGHPLTTTYALTLASDTFRIINPSSFMLAGNGGHTQLHTDLSGAGITVTSGTWTLGGVINTSSVSIQGGYADAREASIHTPTLNVLGNATLDIREQVLTTVTAFNTAATATVLSEGTHILIDNGSAVYGWNNVDFGGTITLGINGILTLPYNNKVDSMQVAGKIAILGSNTIHYLQASGLAELRLGSAQTQTLDTLAIDATVFQHVHLQAANAGITTLAFTKHEKLCLDYLEILDVALTGETVIVVGSSSTVSNSTGWVQADACDDIPLADFDVALTTTCDYTLATFTDLSTGAVAVWHWDFGNNGANDNIATTADASHQYTRSGTYVVTLTVTTAADYQQTYSRTIDVQGKPELSPITIDNGTLTCGQTADHYQWYRNGTPIQNATAKTFTPTGGGIYTVLMTLGQCDYLSDEFVVTAAEPGPEQAYRLAPNPADGTLMISTAPRRCTVTLYNAMGQYAGSAASDTGTVRINTSTLQDGLYIADLNGHKVKFLVLHR